MLQFFKNNLDALDVIEQTNCIKVYQMQFSGIGKTEYLLTFMPDMDMMLKNGITIPSFDNVQRFSITVFTDKLYSVDELQKRIDDELKSRSERHTQFDSLQRFNVSADKPFSNHKSFINYNNKEA